MAKKKMDEVENEELLQEAKAAFEFEEIERDEYGTVIPFEEIGESVTGEVSKIRKDVETENGTCDVLQLINKNDSRAAESDGRLDIFLSRYLCSYDWEKLMGKFVKIEMTGFEKTKSGKRTYKTYKVSVGRKR